MRILLNFHSFGKQHALRYTIYIILYISQTLSYTIKSQLRIEADNLRNSHCVLDLEIN